VEVDQQYGIVMELQVQLIQVEGVELLLIMALDIPVDQAVQESLS
jgi:hypothetical protein